MPQRPGLFRGLVRDPAHGALPALLVILTVATGVIDAVSVLALGRVFVANMTGNVVFLGFALAGAPGFALLASLAALVGFLAGAWLGGELVHRIPADRPRLLTVTCAVECVLVAVALVVAAVTTVEPGNTSAVLVAACAALAMGAQNAVARRLAVPDLTTTVLTMTLTGLAADLRTGHRAGAARRLLAVTAMFAGAVVGALLVLHVGVPAGLGLVLVLLAAATSGGALSGRRSRRPVAPDRKDAP
ncbi:YoaK family protein [Nakamurella deserti]|uniref:YoaK family protein n=1 Tax=Nakamurella deserti TaxID=2164074 RepID=UPI00197C16F5|nr:YoaK family protein [Nakamurella deserti]